MNTINWFLINGANAALWLWDLIVTAASGAWSGVDALLNPILSPLLAFLNPVTTAIADSVYAILDLLPAWVGLTLISAVAGVVMLIGFRYTSNQTAIGRCKDVIKANLLALKLFKDDLTVTFQSQRKLFGALARLQFHMLVPFVVMLGPMLLVLAQMGLLHQQRPIHPDEQTLITLKLKDGVNVDDTAILEPNEGLITEAGPVPGAGSFVWRVRAIRPGEYTLTFRLNGESYEKRVVVDTRLHRVSAKRCSADWTSQLLHPAEPLLPADSPVAAIEVAYPPIQSRIYGSDWWMLSFFVVSMVTALLLKPVFRVKF
jgi:hypothetical protein